MKFKKKLKIPILLVITLFLINFSSADTTFYEGDYFIENTISPTGDDSSCNSQWSCGDWTFCKNKLQTRVCTNLNNCNKQNPNLIQSCNIFSDIINKAPKTFQCISLKTLDTILNKWKNNMGVSLENLDKSINIFKSNRRC